VRRACRANQHARIGRPHPLPEDCREHRLRVAGAADHAIQQRELERGLARRLLCGDRFEQRLGFRVLAARNGELRENGDCR
jgi:hypothetical protein